MGFPKFGGIGGKGGDVIVKAKEGETLNKVLKKFPSRLVKAKGGENSQQFRLLGTPGEDVIVSVPTGVTIYDETGTKLGELNSDTEQVIVAKGGIGGNPENSFSGGKGEEHRILIDLKLIADVGLVGFPNAGKSTFLKAASRAKPRIASYPFTTLKPNIGVMEYEDLRQISVADLPGLIEGAHQNIGLGHKFLRHVERTKLLLFLVDIEGFRLSPMYPHRNVLETIMLLNKELELYSGDLVNKPAILLINKMDAPGASAAFKSLVPSLHNLAEAVERVPEEMRPNRLIKFEDIIPISARSDSASVTNVKNRIRNLLDVSFEYNLSQETNGASIEERKKLLEMSLYEKSKAKLV
uniref:EOG090X0ACU n=1 Tax=Lynceus sp. MCZ IZ 141354 TaxID=1930659 RepID=A0A9N6WZ58_9CRUS|nr:EOG090X0ACU [Lynceus sp. MCZ IZ 141354]